MKWQDILTTMREALGYYGNGLVAESCHLWMWATSNFLPDALRVMGGLGFEYKTSAVWVKAWPVVRIGPDDHGWDKPWVDVGLQLGLGQYMRHSHEWLLLGTRGPAAVPPPERRQPSVIIAPRTTHSTKPAEACRLIECTSEGPRLEMFARAQRPGWDVWGNEVNQEEMRCESKPRRAPTLSV
jgi:N6-adenosine-specific RNA methylase IME4